MLSIIRDNEKIERLAMKAVQKIREREAFCREIDGENLSALGNVVPSWQWVTHEADENSVVFGFSDRPVQQKLDLFREARGNA